MKCNFWDCDFQSGSPDEYSPLNLTPIHSKVCLHSLGFEPGISHKTCPKWTSHCPFPSATLSTVFHILIMITQPFRCSLRKPRSNSQFLTSILLTTFDLSIANFLCFLFKIAPNKTISNHLCNAYCLNLSSIVNNAVSPRKDVYFGLCLWFSVKMMVALLLVESWGFKKYHFGDFAKLPFTANPFSRKAIHEWYEETLQG